MLNLRGLHNGSHGLWDPRSDVNIYNLDSIKKFASEFSIPNFIDYVGTHEQSQRGYYQYGAIMDIASFSDVIRKILTSDEKLSVDYIEICKRLFPSVNRLLDEVNPIWDANYALVLYHILCVRRKSFFRKLTKEDAEKVVASNLSEPTSKKAFDALISLYKKAGNNGAIPNFITNYSLARSLVLVPSRDHETITPQKMFVGLVTALDRLYQTDPRNSAMLFKRITKFVNSQSFYYKEQLRSINNMLRKYWPEIDYVEVEDRLTRQYSKRVRRAFVNQHLGKNFFHIHPLKLMKGPPLSIFFDNGKYVLTARKNARKYTVWKTLERLLTTYIQDCIWSGNPISCVFCELGICKKVNDQYFLKQTHDIVAKIERKMARFNQ